MKSVLTPPFSVCCGRSLTALSTQADFSDPDWKDTFFGSNYPKLLRIKDKWDPDQLMYGSTAVGGDRWVERLDGRLCRTA